MPEGSLSQRERRRYSKQILISEIGIQGQEKFKRSSVIVVGAGGLGCPVLQYLVAGGIGRVALVDFDMVDETNLQRQLLYGSNDLGKLKSVIARTRLEELNPMVKIEVLNLPINASNSLNILKDFDIIVDATDNFESRFLINDSCVILNKPMVHGAIHKFEGEVSVFNYKNGPTYRCYNPFSTHGNYEDLHPSDVGLLGVLAGITGSVMANEVFKIIAGIGDILAGKILIINILNNSFHTMKITGIPENHNIKEVGIIPKKS
jgi:molybdopterin/thiamine biosynthesis adenylyltransferase